MGLFDKIKEAAVTEGGVYVLPGIYRCQIKACKQRQTRKGIGMVAVELTVLESTNPDRPPGSEMSWVATADKDAFMGNVKQFIAATMGVKYEEVDNAGAEAIFSEEKLVKDENGNDKRVGNPFKGWFVRISAFNKPTKEGKDFTRVWFINDKEGSAAAMKAHESQASGKTEGAPSESPPKA